MCGFYGCIGKDKLPAKSLEYRGPNQYGFYVNEKLSLHQWRLSILDLNKQELPWHNDNYWLLYNGEIYNYIELKQELIKLGHKFKTTCDAEVILEAFDEWGIKCFEKFIGMWAIVIIQKGTTKVLASRDIAGKKPLFYRFGDNYVEFSSEIKSFDNLEYEEVDSVKYWEFCFNDETCFKDVAQVEPSKICYFDIERNGYYDESYFDIDWEGEINEDIKFEEAVEEFDLLLQKSIDLRKRSDVPIGQFISGGWDSTLIYSYLNPNVVSYYDLLDDSYNIVKELTNNKSKLLSTSISSKEELQLLLSKISYHLEMPVGHLSVPIWWKLSEVIKNYAPVVYSGEGADELFNGYTRNEIVLYEDDVWNNKFPFKGYEPIKEKYIGSIFDRLVRMYTRNKSNEGDRWMYMKIYENWNFDRPLHWNLKKLEFSIGLQPLLQISDRMTMAHSIELRCPFLDKEIIKFAFSLPLNITWNGRGKKIIKELLKKRLHLSENFLNYNNKKTGMAIPYEWFSNNITDRSYWNSILKQYIQEQLC